MSGIRGKLPLDGEALLDAVERAVNRGHQGRDLTGNVFVGQAHLHRVRPDRRRHFRQVADRLEAAAYAQNSNGQRGENEE